MYLTDRKNDITRDLGDHDDVEILLESFSKQVEEIVNEAENIEVSFWYLLLSFSDRVRK
jgi:magnesium transporter